MAAQPLSDRHAVPWRGGVVAVALLTLALGTPAPVSAREAADLGTDRDAFTPAAHTVRPGVALWEGSYVFIDNPAGAPTNNYPELLLRIGAAEWFEWRLGVNYGVGSQGNVVTSVEVGERLEVHAEYFDSSTQGLVVDTNRGFFSPGMHYLLTRNFEIGLRLGWGVTAEAAPFFSDAGFGWRW